MENGCVQRLEMVLWIRMKICGHAVGALREQNSIAGRVSNSGVVGVAAPAADEWKTPSSWVASSRLSPPL